MARFELRHQLWTRVDKHGRVVIPAEFRDQLELAPGTKVRIWVEDGALHLMSLDEGIRQVQAIARKYTGGRKGLVDEFIADRRREAERELYP
jgi:AbrB family looped-hinge helix DNA binding protein